MIVKFDFSLDALMKVQVEADSLEDAKDKLYRMSVGEMLENGYVESSDIKDIDSTIIEKDVTVKVSNIKYDISDEDVEENTNYTYKQLLEILPTEKIVEISDYNEKEDDLEELIADAVSEETGWLVDSFTYTIIKEK